VYTALAHGHVPVDPIDEVMLAQTDLARYKAIYLNGSHLPRKSAEALARYVHRGGILWTSGWGCARDEADEPLKALEPVLGLEARAEPELWYKVQRYGAVAVQSFADQRAVLAPVPTGAKIVGEQPYAAAFLAVVGREVLKPAADTQVLARFADGAAAMTVHPYGQGRAYVVGFYPGLEYSATIRDGQPDMSRDLDAARRRFITGPALTVTQPVVEPSVPAVEGVLLHNPSLKKRAVVLMNWAYRLTGSADQGKLQASIVEMKDVDIILRGAGPVARATSAMLDQDLPVRHQGDALRLKLPRLEEGDVLVLEQHSTCE